MKKRNGGISFLDGSRREAELTPAGFQKDHEEHRGVYRKKNS